MAIEVRRSSFIHSPWRGRAIAYGAAAVAALAVILFAPAWLTGLQRVVAAYDAAALLLVVALWAIGMHGHPSDTECRAAVEDPGHNAVLGAALLSVVGGLVSAISIIGRGPHVATANEKAIVYVLGLGAVVLGWFVIHTLFTLRYAHLYYFDDDGDNESDRGLTFPGTTAPNDYDFAYFSFVVGMTFQVSDVQITDSKVRRIVLIHALISFGYNSTIVALVINLISGLIH